MPQFMPMAGGQMGSEDDQKRLMLAQLLMGQQQQPQTPTQGLASAMPMLAGAASMGGSPGGGGIEAGTGNTAAPQGGNNPMLRALMMNMFGGR